MAIQFAFLHGGVQGGWVWDDTIAALRTVGGETVRRCLVLDVPGCGTKRGRETATMPFDAIVSELIADIEAAGTRNVVLVGHSQAGSLLPRMVEARPGLYGRIIYVSCIAPETGQTVLVGTAGSSMRAREVPDQASSTSRFREMFCNDMDEARANAFLGRLGQDMWPPSSYAETAWRYDHLKSVPSSYFMCLRDAAVVPERQAQFAARLHAARLYRMDAGHQVMNSRPYALAEALLAEARA